MKTAMTCWAACFVATWHSPYVHINTRDPVHVARLKRRANKLSNRYQMPKLGG